MAAVSFSIYSILLKKTEGIFSVTDTTKKIFYYGTVILAFINIFSKSFTLDYFYVCDIFGSLLFLGIGASCFAFIMWNKSIQIIGTVRTNQYIYFIPFITSVMSWVILGEVLTIQTITGTAVILSGIYISEDRGQKADGG